MLAALQRAHALWTERSPISRDAAHGSRVLGAMLKSVEALPGQPGGQTATFPMTHAAETTQTGRPAAAAADALPNMALEDPIDFSDFMNLDDVLGDTQNVDWVSLCFTIGP